MKICEYGCGQEAKYQFKNGKWCCSKNVSSCLAIIKKLTRENNHFYGKQHTNEVKENQSKKMKELHKNPDSKYNSIEYKEKLSNRMKELWEDLIYKEKISNIMKDLWEDPDSIFNSIIYRNKLKESWKDLNLVSRKEKISNIMKDLWEDSDSVFNSILYKNKFKLSIENINKKYPFFSKIEEMRYNPDKPEEKEIQIHCKNHKCKNSKEKGGWFTPTRQRFKDRKDFLENEGLDRSGFYCSEKCKNTCPLYNIQSDPYKNNNLPYTYTEYQTFRTFVLERDNHICQFCGKPATDVHHERPQKLEPFSALDPDYAWSCCGKCHYKKGHQGECSTGNLAKIVCSVESQKFLEQKI
jgi:hypothetical protein